MKYLIQLENGYFIREFFGNGIRITENKASAGVYTKEIAIKRLKDRKILEQSYTLINTK